MIIVTGGAGFIGANLIKALNFHGLEDILVVDEATALAAKQNFADLKVRGSMEKIAFLEAVQRDPAQFGSVTAVLHQGACSDTMATDEEYVLGNNLEYSKKLYQFCAQTGAQYLYASSASVYGDGAVFVESPQYESTLNLYAKSKLMFDQFVRQQPTPKFQCVGLRYFNVYGAREQHKGRMASVAWHFYNQYQNQRSLRLFEGSGGYAHGEQRRDFVSVEDVARVNLFFMQNPQLSGIYNVGSGQSCSFNQVALAVINASRAKRGEPEIDLEHALETREITYIPMPQALRGKYQSYTQADISRLRDCGYADPFLSIEQGVRNYLAEIAAAPPSRAK